jgi:hypothetical protein
MRKKGVEVRKGKLGFAKTREINRKRQECWRLRKDEENSSVEA